MPFSRQEFIKNNRFDSLGKEVQDNIMLLQEKMNALQKACIDAGLTVTVWNVTSGLRTKADHLRIYRDIAAKKGVKFDISKVPMGSQHLIGAAVDIADPKLEITAFLKKHPEIIKEIDLYFEDGNANWVHAQLFKPKSGKRWFLP